MTILGPDRDPLLDDLPLEVEDEHEPEPPPRGWNRRGLLGAVIGLAAAGVTLVGSFLRLFTADLKVGGVPEFTLTVTSWRIDPTTQFDPLVAVSNGIPLVFGMVLVGFGAVAGLLAAAPSAPLGMRRLAGVLVAVGAAFLAGSVWTVGMEVSSLVDSFDGLGRSEGFRSLSVATHVGIGFWLLLGAVLASILGMVLTFLPPSLGRQARRAALAGGGAVVWQLEDDEPERVEPLTPAVGFPVLDDPLDLPQPYSPEPTL